MQYQEVNIAGLFIQAFTAERSSRMVYILSFAPLDRIDIEPLAERFGCSIAVVSGIDWDNDMTPWEAPGVPANQPPFGGKAEEFLRKFVGEVMPEVEHVMGVDNPERTLVGVSLSGLFALWAWVKDTTPFVNVASLSGSFWYEGFVEWLDGLHIRRQEGLVYISLGDKESRSNIREFRAVKRCTQRVVARLKAAGDKVLFETLPGDHFSPLPPRLANALSAILVSPEK